MLALHATNTQKVFTLFNYKQTKKKNSTNPLPLLSTWAGPNNGDLVNLLTKVRALALARCAVTKRLSSASTASTSAANASVKTSPTSASSRPSKNKNSRQNHTMEENKIKKRHFKRKQKRRWAFLSSFFFLLIYIHVYLYISFVRISVVICTRMRNTKHKTNNWN